MSGEKNPTDCLPNNADRLVIEINFCQRGCMSLSFPSRIGDQVPASYEAQDNLTKLLQTDHRGGRDQVVTRVSLEYLQRMKDLRPGYFDGVKTWAKSGFVYVAAGVATVSGLGAAGYGIYKIGQYASDSGYGLRLAVLTASIGWICSECGFKPVNALAAFVAVTVRDSANRAAKSYVKGDERAAEVKEAEAKDCRKEILKQLEAVYNDCAKELQERYELAGQSKDVDKRLELRQMAVRLAGRLPTIEKLLTQIGLASHEVETILQRFKDRVRFVQHQTCRLEAKQSCGKTNAEMIASWSKDSMGEIAVPYAIKERVSAANKCRYTTLDRLKGYGSVAVSGATALAVSAAAIATFAAGCHAYQNGFGATMSRIQQLAQTQNWGWPDSGIALVGWGSAGLGVAGATTAVVVKKTAEHQKAIESNGEYVEAELNACVRDLQTIYGGVNTHLSTNRSMMSAVRERAPAIRQEIQQLGLVSDPVEILGNLAKM